MCKTTTTTTTITGSSSSSNSSNNCYRRVINNNNRRPPHARETQKRDTLGVFCSFARDVLLTGKCPSNGPGGTEVINEKGIAHSLFLSKQAAAQLGDTDAATPGFREETHIPLDPEQRRRRSLLWREHILSK